MKNKTKLYKEFFEAVNNKMAIERTEVHANISPDERNIKIEYYQKQILELRKLINNNN